MPLKIIRNDLLKVEGVDAIVNTANPKVAVGAGCDTAVYNAAGREELLKYRKDNIGNKNPGDVFVTPAFNLNLKCIIHAVSPVYRNGRNEDKLRRCYSESLRLARESDVSSIAIPLISTGSLGYPRPLALSVAVDEINKFLLINDMVVYLVVFDKESSDVAGRISGDIESYIDEHYADETIREEYECDMMPQIYEERSISPSPYNSSRESAPAARSFSEPRYQRAEGASTPKESALPKLFSPVNSNALNDRLKHLSDTFSEYLLYLIKTSGMKNSEVYISAGIDKKVFSKIKNNRDYHPSKMTAMCLCVGARLNIDQTRDLLSRAGYALSPSDKTDVIFSYFIENQIYDLVEIDIVLEEQGLPYFIA